MNVAQAGLQLLPQPSRTHVTAARPRTDYHSPGPVEIAAIGQQ
jgi:hypothetical protein